MGLFNRHGMDNTSAIADVFSPLVKLQTYKNLVYLILAFPLGLMYSMMLGLGFIFGVGLSVIALGVVILLSLVPVVRVLTAFERWLTSGLLGITVNESEDITSGDGLRVTVRAYLDATSTWRGLGFLTLKFWLGIIGLILLMAFATAFSMISAVVRLPHDIEFGEVNGEPVVWTVETFPEAALAAVIGSIIAVFLVHLTNGFAYVARRMANSLL